MPGSVPNTPFAPMPSEMTERQAFLVLNALPNIGPITLNRLLGELGGDPRTVLTAGAQRLQQVQTFLASAL